MKKILISIVSAVTLMLLFVLCANAAVAKVDGQEYDTLSDALTAAQDGGTVVLLSDAVIDETISIEKSITIDGKGFKLIPADTEKTYASAIMAGNSGWGESDGSVKISLENVDISGWTVNYGVIRAQGVDLTVDGCTFSNNTVLLYAYAVVSSNYSKSLIKNSKFESNSGKAIDVNYNIETSTTPVTVEGCTFNNNETTQPGIVMRSRGQIFVRNCVFTNNEISTSGNAATLYVGFGTGSEVTGCYFANNSVVTNKTADTRIGSAIFCDGTTVTGNVFAEGNALTYAGGALPYVVSIGAYYGQPNISGNYWQGHEPKLNTDYRVEFANYEVLVDNYYNSYKVENGVYTVYNREIVYVAQVGNAKYETLAEAVEAAKNGGTVVLLSNVDLGTTTLEIPAGYDIVLDLNGKVISGRTGSSNEKALIRVNNEATLTVVDGAEGGKITMAKGGSAEGFTIDVKGNLILNSGTIELTGAWSIGFAVDVRPNAWGTAYKEKTTFVMNGGKIVSSDGGVRVDSNSSNDYEALGVYFTMNGGEIVRLYLKE